MRIRSPFVGRLLAEADLHGAEPFAADALARAVRRVLDRWASPSPMKN